jgi:hypothetical protein
MKKILHSLIVTLILISGSSAFASDAETSNKIYNEGDTYYNSGRYYNHGNYNDAEGDMIIDAFVVRPLGIIGTAAGAVVWVVSLPFSLLGGNTGESANVLVKEPFTYTFNRPLGDFEDSYPY